MNGYLTSSLSALLSWVKGLASAVWQMVTGEDAGTFLRFVTEHWKGILVILCAAGLAADFLVYLFRWQPYKVWISFIRRLRDRRKTRDHAEEKEAVPDEAGSEPVPVRQELPALPARVRRRRAYFPENESPQGPVEEQETPEQVLEPSVEELKGMDRSGTEGERPRRRRRRSAP